MNIKKMMTALACAVAVGFSANAADWFNGGIGEDWPNDATMSGGAWSGDSTNTSSYADGKLNIVLDDNKDPLTFTANSMQPGEDADSVTVSSTIGFSAYEFDDKGVLPDVPGNAKAAVTFVATNDDATAGQFYYLGYDDTVGVESNVWVESKVYSDITGDFSVAQGIKVTLAQGAEGFWAVTYEFAGDDVTTINTTVKKDSSAYVGVVAFAGNGPGFVKTLTGEYAEKTYAVTIDAASLATDKGLVATNVTVNGQSITNTMRAAEGAVVTVHFMPADGMKFAGSATSYEFTMGTEPVTINANTEGLPETESAYVSMYFYDYNYDSEFEDDHLIYTEEGVEGAAWTQDDLLEAANDPDNQPTGMWFDGTWSDTDFEPAELPEVIEKDAKFVMNATNITYYIRQDFDGGEGDEDPTYEINEDESQEITLIEPTKTGATFKAWEVVGDLPEGVSIDGATITIDASAIGDVNVKATWEAAQGTMFYIGDTGYKSWAEAIEAAEPGATIKVGTDAVIPADTVLAKAVTLDLNGNTLSIGAGCSVAAALTVSNTSGSLAIANELAVSAALDLSGLTYAQTVGCTGGFALAATGKVSFPSDVAYPACAGAISSAANGAQIVAASTTYTKAEGLWVVGTTGIAVAKIGTTGYESLDAALNAAQADDVVTLCADIETAVAQQWTIAKNITIDFATYTITKTVANDWVFTVANDADVTFTGTTGGIVHYPAVLNQGYPASMIQILGKLTVEGGVYESDYTVFKVDEGGDSSAAGELVVNGGTFTIAPRPGTTYTGKTYAIMNWSKATINGGTWTGDLTTLSNDGNKTVKAGETIIGTGFASEGAVFKLQVCGSTYENVPKIKGVAIANVKLVYDTTKITDDLVLTTDGDYVTVGQAVAQVGDVKYASLADAFAAAGTENVTVKLLRDVTLTGEWTPVNGFKGTFDGNNKTISGLTINQTGVKYIGFFSTLGSGAIVKDVTFTGANVTGGDNTAIVAGCGSICTFDNVKVENSVVTGAAYLGALFGYDTATGDHVVMTNVAVIGCSITATKKGGAIAGQATVMDIIGAVVSNNTYSAGDRNGAFIGMYNLAHQNTLKDIKVYQTDMPLFGTVGGTGEEYTELELTGEGTEINVQTLIDTEIASSTVLKIKGGTYNIDPTDYVASGYKATESEGKWTVAATSGPTPAAGSDTKVTPVAGEENTYKLEPTGTSTEVAVDNVTPGDTLIVDATVTAIGVQEGEQSGVIIRVRNSGDTADIPAGAMYGWDGNSYGTALDPDGYVAIAGEEIPVTPAATADATTPISDGAVATKTIPGLTYQLIRGDEVGSIETALTTEGAKVTATTTSTTLVDSNKPETKAFYKIQVMK